MVMSMDAQIRADILSYLEQQSISQVEVAKRIGIAPQSVNRFLKGERGSLPKSMVEVLDALGLELYVRPKGSEKL